LSNGLTGRVLGCLSLIFLTFGLLPAEKNTTVLPGKETGGEESYETVLIFEKTGKTLVANLSRHIYGQAHPDSVVIFKDNGILFIPTDPMDHLATAFFPLPPQNSSKKRLLRIEFSFYKNGKLPANLTVMVQKNGLSNIGVVSFDALREGSLHHTETINVPEETSEIRLIFMGSNGKPAYLPQSVKVEHCYYSGSTTVSSGKIPGKNLAVYIAIFAVIVLITVLVVVIYKKRGGKQLADKISPKNGSSIPKGKNLINSSFSIFTRFDRSRKAAVVISILIFCVGCGKLFLDANPLLMYNSFFSFERRADAYFYRLHHGRPMEKCDTFIEDRNEILSRLDRNLNEIQNRWLGETKEFRTPFTKILPYLWKIQATLTAYALAEKELGEFFDSPCEGSWEYNSNTVLLFQHISYETPYLWLFEVFGIAHFYAELFVMFIFLLGIVCLFLIVRRISSSNLIGLISFAVLFFLIPKTTYSNPVGQDGSFIIILPLIYLTQIMASSRIRLLNEKFGILSIFLEVGMAVSFLIFSFTTFMVYPSLHRAIPYIMLFSLLLIGIKKRNRRIFLRSAILGTAFFLSFLPYKNFLSERFKPVSNSNYVMNEPYIKEGIFIGLYERPTYYCIPFGDISLFAFPHKYDPLLATVNPDFTIHQSFQATGEYFFKDLILKRPHIYLEALWKRIFDNLYFHRELTTKFYPLHGFSWWYLYWWVSVLILFLVFIHLLFVRTGWASCFPVLMAFFWEYFGLHTVFYYPHINESYFIGGIFLSFYLCPGFIAFLISAGKDRFSLRLDTLRAKAVRFRSKLKKSRLYEKLILAGALVFLVYLTSYFYREIKKEYHAFNIIYPIMQGFTKSPKGHTPDEIVKNIESIREAEHNSPGIVDMFGAGAFISENTLRFSPYVPESFRIKGLDKEMIPVYFSINKNLSQQYYRQALIEAPENPYLYFNAYIYRIPEWPDVYRKAVNRFPDFALRPFMLHKLIENPEVSHLTDHEKKYYTGLYVRSIGDLFKRTARFRPGFQRIPEVAPGQKVQNEETKEGLQLTLSAHQKATLMPVEIYRSPEVIIGLYAKFLEGDCNIEINFESTVLKKEFGDQQSGSYRFYKCSSPLDAEKGIITLRAGSNGAKLIIRDLYPMILRPRLK